MGDWLYEIRGLKKSFIPGRPVLDVKTLSIPRGKMTAIVGASGSGKTTFMNILGGLLKPDLSADDDPGASSIQLKLPDGRIFNLSDGGANLPRDAVSFVFQEGHLLKNGTIGLNLGVARLLAKRTAKKAKLEEWRDFSRLSEAEPLSRRVGQLSGGQQQRVGLARAFARNPQIIFADEPSSSLDPSLGMEMMRELAAWCAAEPERTVLWVTHNYDQAKLADKLLVLKGGGVLDGAIEPIDCPKSADEIKRLVYGEEHAEPIDFPPPPEDPPRTRLQSWFSLFPQILKGFSLAGAELWRPAEKEGFNPFRFFRQYSRWPATIMLASVIALTVLIGSAASIAQTHFERQVNDSRLRHVLIEGNLLKRRCSGITPPHLRQLDRLFKSRLETRVSEPCDERNAPDMELLLDIERDQATEVDAASAMGNRSNERIAFARRHDLVTFDSRMGIDHGLDAYSNRLDNRLLMMETNEPLLFEEPVLPLSEFPRRRTSSHVNMTLHQVLVEDPPCYDDRTGDADACNPNREMPGVPSRKSIVVSRDVMLMLICQSSAGRRMMALTPKDNEDEFAFLDRKDATFEDARSVCLDRSPSSFTQAELSNLWGSEGVPKIYIGLTRGQHQEFDIAGYFPNDMSDGITTFRAVTTFANAEYAVAENDNVGPRSRWRQKVNNPRAAAVYFTPDTYETVFSLLDGQHYTYDRNMVERFGRLLSLSSTLNYLFVFARFGSLVVGFAIICSIVMSYLTENTRSFSVLIAHGRALPILTISLVLQILFASILAVVFVLAIASLGFGALVHYKLFNLDLLGASPTDFLVYNLVVPSAVIVVISLIATLLIMVVWRARNRGRLAEALSQS